MSSTELPQRASEVVASVLAGPSSNRRKFLLRVAAVGSAFAAAPVRYLLEPDTAYGVNCPAPGGCSSGGCTDGYSTFCCTLTGNNSCPSGTRPGGWWYACIQTRYCSSGRRYYLDCIGNCPRNCSGCRCANGSCGNRRVCCNHGYTNCGGAAAARLRCRIVRCVNPCNLFASCSCSGGRDQATCRHDAGCFNAPNSCSC
jgi:hypothetical protein